MLALKVIAKVLCMINMLHQFHYPKFITLQFHSCVPHCFLLGRSLVPA